MIKSVSLRKRYFSKLIANIVATLGGALSSLIVPRSLGPAGYGAYSYITNFFTQVFNLFDGTTSIAFYTKLSQRQEEHSLISFYWRVVIIINTLIIASLLLILLLNLEQYFLPGQKNPYILLGCVLASLLWLTRILYKIFDAYALTVYSERIKVLMIVARIGALFSLFFLSQLNLLWFFVLEVVISLLTCTLLFLLFHIKGFFLFPRYDREKTKAYIRDFYKYSQPLIVYSIFSVIAAIFDRWILQNFAGSIEQGFFSLGYRVGTICFLFTRSMTSLFHRELSISIDQGDSARVRAIFVESIAILYFLSAFISIFAMFNVDSIIHIIGGNKFKGASLVVSLMFLYPLHQTYGQLVGTYYLSSGETKLYRNLGMITIILGALASYFLLAPRNLLGLELKSLGLALKLLFVQFVTTNVMMLIASKRLKISFLKLLAHQLAVPIFFGVIATGVLYIQRNVVIMDINILLQLIFSFIGYCLVVFLFLLLCYLLDFPVFFTSMKEFVKKIR